MCIMYLLITVIDAVTLYSVCSDVDFYFPVSLLCFVPNRDRPCGTHNDALPEDHN